MSFPPAGAAAPPDAPLPPGEAAPDGEGAGPDLSDRARASVIVGAQLVLVLVVVRTFEVAAQNTFFPVLCILAGGFLVHTWLPVRLRPALFPLVSAGGVLFFLGWPDGAWALGIGGGLIAVCYLP